MYTSMRTFMRGQMSKGQPQMVFDWEKAARLIKERQPLIVEAGLRDDWGYTGGRIWEEGKPVPEDDTYTFLSSTWAVPELDLDGERLPCFIMESETEWNSGTYWPPEALAILEE